MNGYSKRVLGPRTGANFTKMVQWKFANKELSENVFFPVPGDLFWLLISKAAQVCRVQGYNLVSSRLQNLLFTDPACLTVPPSIILLTRNASKEDIVRKVLIRSKTNHFIKLQISRPSESIFRRKFG